MSAGAVLVVNPDVAFAEGLVRVLGEAGIAAVSVPDGERAIDRFVQEPAAALVVDVLLPGRDGAATVESIRWAPGGARVPIVLTCIREGGEERLTDTSRRLGVTSTTRAGERDPHVVAALVRRVLASLEPAPPPPPSETRTAEHMLPTPHSATKEAHVDDIPLIQEDESLPPRGSDRQAAPERPPPANKDRATVAARAPRAAGRSAEEAELAEDPGAQREAADVARAQREITPGAATLTGDLAQLAFARLLSTLATERATGALVVLGREDDPRQTTNGEAPKKVVYFRVGVPVYVKSNLVRETLGEILVRSSVIDAETHREAVMHMRAGEGRLGGILLATGAIAPRDLRSALAEQLRTKLFDLFGWDQGQYRFSRRVLPPPEVVTLELGLPEIVFEGVARKVPPQRLLAQLAAHADSYVVPEPGATERFASLDLVAEARLVLRAIDGTRTLRDLGSVAGKRPAAAAQLVHAMECLGLARFSATPTHVPPSEDGHGRGGRAEALAAPLDLAAARDELHRLMRAIREDRYADALSGPANVGEAEAEAARLVARFSPLVESGIAPREVRALATEVCLRLARAREDGRLLANGRETRLERGEAAAPARIPAWEDDTSESGDHPILAPHDPYAVGAARLLPVRPPSEPPRIDDIEVPTMEEAIPSRSDSVTPAEPLPPPSLATLRTGDLPRDPPTDALDAAALDARVARLADAERLFRRGERALARDRFVDAIDSFERAVQLVPDEGEFVAHLAWARFRASPDDPAVRAAAIAGLDEATTLSPKLAKAHLLRGHLRRALGDLAGAREAYEAAAAAAPDSTDALAALRSI